MKSLARETGTRLLVLGVMLCAFTVISVMGYAWVIKTAMLDDWGINALRA